MARLAGSSVLQLDQPGGGHRSYLGGSKLPGRPEELFAWHAGESLDQRGRRQAGNLFDLLGVETAVIVERHRSSL
jgi:hypothetical protein